MARLTLKSIAKALVAEGFPADIELVQGDGYLYFSGGDAHTWYSSSVCVCRLNHLTLDQWIAEAKSLSARRY